MSISTHMISEPYLIMSTGMCHICIDMIKLALALDEHLYLFSRKSHISKVAESLWASLKFLCVADRPAKCYHWSNPAGAFNCDVNLYAHGI